MDIMPPRVTLGLAIAGLVLCGVVAPIQWAQGNTAGALVLGFFAVTSLLGGVSVLRRQRGRPAVETPVKSEREEVALSVPTSAPAPASPAEDPRWHVTTPADILPDPADRRKVLWKFIGAGLLFLAGVVACCIGAGVTGDLTFMAFAVMLAVPVLVILYIVVRNRADLRGSAGPPPDGR